jgi:hypothetical protein
MPQNDLSDLRLVLKQCHKLEACASKGLLMNIQNNEQNLIFHFEQYMM